MGITRDDLPLQRVYRWELECAGRVFLTQPSGGGQIRHWTWAQAVGEARRMATHLRAQGWEPGSRVAILSKNCAWWIMSDLAIWMAGHVSVPDLSFAASQPRSARFWSTAARGLASWAPPRRNSRPESPPPAGVTWIPFPNAEGGEPYTADWEDGDADERTHRRLPGPGRRRAGHHHLYFRHHRHAQGRDAPLRRPGVRCAHSGGCAGSATTTSACFPTCRWRTSWNARALRSTRICCGWHLFFTEGMETFLADLRARGPRCLSPCRGCC